MNLDRKILPKQTKAMKKDFVFDRRNGRVADASDFNANSCAGD